MSNKEFVADIKIKEKKDNHYSLIDSFKNKNIDELILLLELKYGNSTKGLIDKIIKKATIKNKKLVLQEVKNVAESDC